MRKIWNFLFDNDKHIGHHRGPYQRDLLAEIYFLSRTGIPLDAVDGSRRSAPKTEEFGLRDY